MRPSNSSDVYETQQETTTVTRMARLTRPIPVTVDSDKGARVSSGDSYKDRDQQGSHSCDV